MEKLCFQKNSRCCINQEAKGLIASVCVCQCDVLGHTCWSLWGMSMDSKWNNYFITFWGCRFNFNIILKTVRQTFREKAYSNIDLALAQSLCSVCLKQHFQRSPWQSKSCPAKRSLSSHMHSLFCWWEWCGCLSLYLEIFRWIESSFSGSF